MKIRKYNSTDLPGALSQMFADLSDKAVVLKIKFKFPHSSEPSEKTSVEVTGAIDETIFSVSSGLRYNDIRFDRIDSPKIQKENYRIFYGASDFEHSMEVATC